MWGTIKEEGGVLVLSSSKFCLRCHLMPRQLQIRSVQTSLSELVDWIGFED